MSLLNTESPSVNYLFNELDIELLWHPSLSNHNHLFHQNLVDQIIAGEKPIDILCVEGSIIRGPGGTGMYDAQAGKPKPIDIKFWNIKKRIL